MKNKQFLYLSLLVSILYGCNNQVDENDEIIDLNKDGVADVHYEYEDESYYELIDRNFDGKVDQSSQYDSEHYLMSAKSDDDFDGFLETIIVYQDSLMTAVLVDTDNNQLIDIILKYEHDLVSSGEKYYKADDDGLPARIGKVEYQFGYPSKEESILATPLSEEEFHEKANLLLSK